LANQRRGNKIKPQPNKGLYLAQPAINKIIDQFLYRILNACLLLDDEPVAPRDDVSLIKAGA